MKLHRFIGPFACDAATIELTDPEIVNQLSNVLRLAVGDRLVLCDGAGTECICEIAERGPGRIAVSVVERDRVLREPKVRAVLYCAILKRENFELVVQKATEVGIAEIVPVITARTVKLDIRPERLRKIIKEAAEQSGRGVLPVLRDPLPFADAVADAARNDINLFFDIGPGVAIGHMGGPTALRRGIFIGPEGGWDSPETDAAGRAGFTAVSLGALTFRAETAAIIASYLCCVADAS